METFSASLVLCAGNSPVTGEFPTQRPVTQNVDVFFDLPLDKQLKKQPRCRWFERPDRTHCDVTVMIVSEEQDCIYVSYHYASLDTASSSVMSTYYIHAEWISSGSESEFESTFEPQSRSCFLYSGTRKLTAESIIPYCLVLVTPWRPVIVPEASRPRQPQEPVLRYYSQVSMMTSWHGSAFRITGPLWGEPNRWLVDSPHKKPVMRTFYVSFDVSLSKLLNK